MTTSGGFQEEILIHFSLDEVVPEDHLLRKIKKAIDFSFVYDLVRDLYSHTGAPSIDPVVVFKLSLLGYLYNIPSERRIIEDANFHMAYRWFLDYSLTQKMPDHSIFTKVRSRFGVATYRRFFEEVVSMCVCAGLVEGETVFMDATLIEADASKDKVRSKALAAQLGRKAEGYLNALDWDEDTTAPKSKVNRMMASPSDPSAHITKHKNVKTHLAYKGHVAVDGGDARIVTAADLTGGTFPEEYLMWQLLASHEEAVGAPTKRLSADTRYGTSDNYRLLKAKGITAAVPLRKGGRESTGYTKENFDFDKINDRFVCPEGKKLLPAKPVDHYLPYRSRKSDCNRCPVKPACIGKGDRKTVMVSRNESIRLWALSQLDSPIAKKLLRRRKVWPETVFGAAKTQHGLKRAKYRGRWKVKIQLLMTVAVMNMKKLVKYGEHFDGKAFETMNRLAKRLCDYFSYLPNLLRPIFRRALATAPGYWQFVIRLQELPVPITDKPITNHQ